MTRGDMLFGFLNVDKPSGMTSHDVVSKVRRKLRIKKVGHAGTLDPLATGVLVICVGDATRLSEYAMSARKVYEAHVCLGAETTTYDAEGEITVRRNASSIRPEDIEHIFPRFIGVVRQLPPMYSAVKKDGRKLYELAREGKQIEREPRQVEIFDLRMIGWNWPEFMLRVECGSGTYIRSLAHDMGQFLEVGAYLTRLRRTQSGNFHLRDAVTLAAVLSSDRPETYILPPDIPLQHMPRIDLDLAQVEAIQQGRPVDIDNQSVGLGRGYAPDGRLIAILRIEGETARPHKVFSTQFGVF